MDPSRRAFLYFGDMPLSVRHFFEVLISQCVFEVAAMDAIFSALSVVAQLEIVQFAVRAMHSWIDFAEQPRHKYFSGLYWRHSLSCHVRFSPRIFSEVD